MAFNNELEAIMPRLLARGLLVLRRYAVMPQLVNQDYKGNATEKGKTIDVDIPAISKVKDVVPSHNMPEPTGHAWTTVPIPLDQWKSADFALTDKERGEILADEKFLPKQANSAITALVEDMDTYLLNFYKNAFSFIGDPTKAAFPGSVDNAIDAGAKLKEYKVPQGDPLRMVINPAGEASAMKNNNFHAANVTGTMDAIRDGTLEQRFGFMWHVNQGILKHSTEAIAGETSARINPGAKTFVAKADMKLVKGDIISFAGEMETKVVVSYDAAAKSVEFYPPLKETVRPNTAVKAELTGDYYNNLAFHRDAIAMATRPLMSDGESLGSRIQSVTDPVSGLSLRLEVTRQHKQVHYEYDILYGAAVIRPEFLVRVVANK